VQEEQTAVGRGARGFVLLEKKPQADAPQCMAEAHRLSMLRSEPCNAFCCRARPARGHRLEDIPDIFGRMAEFTAGNAGAEVEIADGDAVVFDVVGKVIIALGHGTHEDGNALALPEPSDVVADTHHFRVEAKRHFTAMGRKVIGNGVFDHFNQLLLR